MHVPVDLFASSLACRTSVCGHVRGGREGGVGVFVCVHIHLYARTRVHTQHAQPYTDCMQIHMHTHTHIHTDIHTRTDTQTPHID